MSTAVPVAAGTKPAKKKTSSTARKKRGWGPFQSVLKERSVDFNLTLDVQNLQQQVQDLTTLRDILSTRTLLRPHSPEGSLFHVVKEYFHVFRTGWAVQETGRKRLLGDQDQRQFLHCVMDPEVDVGNGLRGPDVMAEQIILYSTFIKFIRTTLQSYEIVVAEDSVVIKAQATLRFQVLRKTIEMVFPHVTGNECLVAQLVEQEVEPMVGITFFFNSAGKCCRYKMELDFVKAFASIVKDPKKLDVLLGRALIAENCMFGLVDESVESQKPQSALGDERNRLVEELDGLSGNSDWVLSSSPLLQPSKTHHFHNDALFERVVNDYYLIFKEGYRGPGKRGHSQADFISQIFVPDAMRSPHTGGKYVLERWRALSERFEVLGFRQKSVKPLECNDQEGICTVRSMASYTLRITPNSLQSVFPHVLAYRPLVTTLVGSLMVVPSELVFSIEMDTGRIIRIGERMDFIKPMATLLQNKEELSFVMSQALLSLDGGSCYSTAICLLPPTFEDSTWNRAAESEKHPATRRTMTMADILTT